MKFYLKLFLVLGITILFLKYESSMGQSKAKAPKMMYADSSHHFVFHLRPLFYLK